MAGLGGKSRKVGRNALSCKSYKNSNRREKNKIRKLKKHLRWFPDDKCASAAVDVCLTKTRGF